MKKFILVLVTVTALFGAGGAWALPGSGFDPYTICSPIDTNTDFVPFSGGFANGANQPGATVNFCTHYAELLGLLDSAIVDACSNPDFGAFCSLLNPCVADLNGTIVVDERTNPSTVTAVGNGINDAANELRIIGRVLLDTNFDNGVIDYNTLLLAYERNWYQLQCDMLPDFIGGFSGLFPGTINGLLEILTVHVTIGDGSFTVDTSDPNGNVSTASGSWGIVKGLVPILCDFIEDQTGYPCNNPDLQRADYIQFPDVFGVTGDADGDGATNVAESFAYAAETCGSGSGPEWGKTWSCGANPPSPTYVDAALDPNIKPISGTDGLIVTAQPNFPEEGDDVLLRLNIIIPGFTAAGFQWQKNLTDINGETSQTMTLTNVTTADNGLYYCEVDDGTKAPILSQPYVMNVQPQGSVPVGGGLAMGVLAGACALAGAMGIRRKR